MTNAFLCFLALVLCTSLLSAASAGPDSIYYQKRTRFIGYPPYPLKAAERSRRTDIHDLRQTWRIFSWGDEALAPGEAQEKANDFRAKGFSILLFEYNRYLFRDQKPVKVISCITDVPYERVIRNTRAMVDACHTAGLKCFLHLTCSMVDAGLLEDHPDWAAIDMAVGKSATNIYGTGNACINNDDFMKVFYSRLERLIRESNLDGIMQDEIQFFGPTHCGCHWCREKFKKETGFTMPDKPDGWVWHTEIPSYLAWVEWRRAKVVERLQKLRSILKKYNPEGVIIHYLCQNTGGWAYFGGGYVIDDFPKFADGVGLECEPYDHQYQLYWPQIIYELKYLRAVAENMGCAPFTCFYERKPGDFTWNWFMAMSQGSRVWRVCWGLNGKGLNASPSWAPLVAWEEKHEKILMNVKSAAKIGVLFSVIARDRMSTPSWSGGMGWMTGFTATCNALTDGHVAYKVLVDADMTAETLKCKVKTLVLLDTAAMSDTAVNAVRQFVTEGGVLIAGGSTSLYDDQGRPRKDFALADLYGGGLAGECTDNNTLNIPAANHVTGSVTGSLPHNYPFYLLKPAADDVKVVGWMTLADGKKHPGILVRNVGKGKVVYFAGHPAFHYFFHHYTMHEIKPGEFWIDYRDPQYGRLLTRTVGAADGQPALVATNLPAGVVVETYRHQMGGLKGIEVHLANFLGGRVKTGVVPKLFDTSFPDVKANLPDPGKPMTLTVHAKGVKNVYLLSPDFDATVELAFTTTGSACTVILPVLYRYAIVYFSQGDNKDILALNGGKVLHRIPAPKKLLIEARDPLVGTYDPNAAVVFADDHDSFKGGVDIGWAEQEPTRYLYGTMSNVHTATATLTLAAKPANPVLEIGGMDGAASSSRSPLEITLNGTTIFKGVTTYPDQKWAVRTFSIDPADLHIGTNIVEIRNTGHGPRSLPPWFGVSFVRIRTLK